MASHSSTHPFIRPLESVTRVERTSFLFLDDALSFGKVEFWRRSAAAAAGQQPSNGDRGAAASAGRHAGPEELRPVPLLQDTAEDDRGKRRHRSAFLFVRGVIVIQHNIFFFLQFYDIQPAIY